jgi:bifunctional oligoribonuclease and PAP phosphatase NrnA
MNKIDEKSAARLLRENDNILILTHRNPDGDTIGSGFALLHTLKKLGKKAKVVCTDPFPEKYGYITYGNTDEVGENPYVVAVDVADMELIGPELREKYENSVDLCIDHHISNREFAKNLCLRECAAACEIIYDVIKAMGVEIDKTVADCLYTGVSTDTGCFLFSNVTERTHIIAADLIGLGASFVDINRVMFETKSLGYFKLEAAALNTVEMYFGGECAFMTVTQEMQRQAGTKEGDCDGLAGLPRKIEGVLVAATFRETKDGKFKISMRSHAPIDASKICMQFGGGGHARAAGCTFDPETLDDSKKKLLSIIETELKNI